MQKNNYFQYEKMNIMMKFYLLKRIIMRNYL
jgi:hypothetical protein